MDGYDKLSFIDKIRFKWRVRQQEKLEDKRQNLEGDDRIPVDKQNIINELLAEKANKKNKVKALSSAENQTIKENKLEEMQYILDMMAFIHLGISVMYRLSYDKTVSIKNEIKETIKYLDKEFPTWRKSPFLKLNYCIKRGIKHIGLWAISKLYKWNMPMFFINIYKFVVDKLKIDIKF